MGYIDTVENITVHGTFQGFFEGCKSHLCPAPMACIDVASRYRSDYGFKSKLDAGLTAQDALEQLRVEEQRLRASLREKRNRKTERKRVHAEHGTRAGYNSRDFVCRRGDECPSEIAGGISCAEAQRIYVAQRRGVIA